ncbi:MAG TPA: hypothetical protein VII56_14370 [Rhizomicrobium sp.]
MKDRAMANMRRARRAATLTRRPKPNDAFREAVAGPVFDMEEPLREARHLVHVIGAVEHDRGEDNEALAFTAVEADRKLEVVDNQLRRLFKLFRTTAP